MSSALVGLIPAAGFGVRAYPYTASIPKSMLEVDGIPLIERNVTLLRDRLGIRKIVVVVGYRGEVIQRHLGDGSRLGVAITYVTNDRIELNLPYSIYVGSRAVDGPCVIVLADECYVDSNHAALLGDAYRGADVVCAIFSGATASQIRKNYVATVRDGRIVALQEKPAVVSGTQMGTGTYLVSRRVLDELVTAFGTDPTTGPRDWTSWLGGLAARHFDFRPFDLTGRYVNVNSRDDLNVANALARDATFEERSASLVYLAEEPEAVRLNDLIEFVEQAALDELVLVARRTPPALASGWTHPKLRLVVPDRPDLPTGALVLAGLDAARGDLLLLCSADGTFASRDVGKLLVYMRDADLVVGTRTTRQMIEQGTNMRGIVRAAHVVLAKLLELSWWRFDSRFTDICCFYRAVWRSTYRAIRPQLTADGVEVLPEMVIEVLRARRRIIEIPVTYRNPEIGSTEGVRSPYQTPGVFGRVLGLIVRKRLADGRFSRFVRPRAPQRAAGDVGSSTSH